MFSGIIENQGRVLSLTPATAGFRLTLESPYKDLQVGESVCVDGVCLTVVSPNEASFSADISPETIQKSMLSKYSIGQRVNLERALTLSTRVSGHIVMGHVDGVGKILRRIETGEYLKLVLAFDDHFNAWIISKGSIAVNGVSLTVNEIVEDGIELMLIPQTLEQTNLKDLNSGDLVNLEFDWLGKMVSKQIAIWRDNVEKSIRPH